MDKPELLRGGKVQVELLAIERVSRCFARRSACVGIVVYLFTERVQPRFSAKIKTTFPVAWELNEN